MTITIHTFVLGAIKNNTYLIVDDATQQAALVDPAAATNQIPELLEEKGYQLTTMLITHAHFDTSAGSSGCSRSPRSTFQSRCIHWI